MKTSTLKQMPLHSSKTTQRLNINTCNTKMKFHLSPMPITYFLTIIGMLFSHVNLSPFVAALKDVSLLKFGTSGVNVLNMLKIILPEQGHHTGM